MKSYKKIFLSLASLITLGFSNQAQARITSVTITGEIESITLDGPVTDHFAGGTMKVDGQTVIIPRNLVIELPVHKLTLSQLYSEAPDSCKLVGQTGLASSDSVTCNTTVGGMGSIASILANRQEDGRVIAGQVGIEKSQKSLTGVVTYIDHTQGYFRLNGDFSFNSGGTLVRINDPWGRHTIQSGLGCGAGANCSHDQRFSVDNGYYTIMFNNGYPVCIPSTQIGDLTFSKRTTGSDELGVGDPLCPQSNRTGQFSSNSYVFAPLILGDHVLVAGSYELIDGVRLFSAYSLKIHDALTTQRGQPDYLTFAEVEVDVAGFEQNRQKSLYIGFTTLGDSQVDLFSLNHNPANGEAVERIIGTTVGNPDTINQGIVPNGEGIFKIGYDIDFLVGTKGKGPCENLANGGFTVENGGCVGGANATLSEQLKVLTPAFREVVGRSRNKIGNPTTGVPAIGPSFDISGNEAPNGEYVAGAGVGFAEWEEINLRLGWMPFIFEGIPWLLDRRLGPGGCENDPNSPISCQTVATSENVMRLDPFPYSGLDPRGQASALPIRDSILSYYPFSATNRLSYPPSWGITEILGSPITNEDIYSVYTDEQSVLISPLSNDQDGGGGIDPLSLEIVSPPTHGVLSSNGNGTLTYTPNQVGLVTTDMFTYRVAGNNGIFSREESVILNVRERIQPNLTITRAQVRSGRAELQVRGSHALVPNASISLYTQNGVLIGTVAVEPTLGSWIFRRQIDPALLPITTINVRSNYNGNATANVVQLR
jgi:hypothetical protein